MRPAPRPLATPTESRHPGRTPRARRRREPADLVELTLESGPLRLPRPQVEAFLRAGPQVLGVDLARRGAYLGGDFVPLHTREIPFGILVTLARAAGGSLGARHLFQAAWGRPARNEHDLRAVAKQVWRLRQALDPADGAGPLIASTPGGYRLRPDVRPAWIRTPPSRRAGPGAAPLAGLLVRGRVVDPRSLQRAMGRSQATVRRLLARGVRAGALERIGAGRATAYRVLDPRPLQG